MAEKPWYLTDEFFVYEMTRTTEYVEDLAARKLPDGQWEYAIVRWRSGNHSLRMFLRDGRALDIDGLPIMIW